jgi:hypothetical protein
MSNETKFLNLCQVMANLEDSIKILENIGLIPEPDTGIGYNIYNACSVIYRVASEYLEFPNTYEENEVFDSLMQANGNTVDEVSRKVWEQYGIK